MNKEKSRLHILKEDINSIDDNIIECNQIINHTSCDKLRYKFEKRRALLTRAYNTRVRVYNRLQAELKTFTVSINPSKIQQN